MRFASQHRDFKQPDKLGKTIRYTAHRDGKSFWITHPMANSCATVFSRLCATVSAAKKLMAVPPLIQK